MGTGDLLKVFRSYIEICKPRLVLLLYFTGLTSVLVASSIYGYDWKVIILVSLAIIISVMGTNATTAYIDRHIDDKMVRTRKRPVPAELISPARNALIFGLILVIAGIIIGAFVSFISALFILIGFIDSAVIYNALTKRKSYYNIVLGAPAGGMPVLAGWAAAAGGRIDLIAVLMFVLVIVWTPTHIWSLAYFYRDDYRRAKIPMLPVILSPGKVFILLASLNFMLVFFSLFIGFYFGLSPLYLAVSILAGLVIIVFSILLVVKKREKLAWILFKLSSPYLGVIFLSLIIEFVWLM
jgi:protoheme IX farnesyltransferase